MKVTSTLRKEINAIVRQKVRGAVPLVEVGLRDGANDTHWQPNALLWTDDGDLGDIVRLRDLRDINEDPANPGCAELDLYVTTGTGNDRELETNVCVFIRDGRVLGATAEGRGIEDLRKSLNFPATRGW